MSVKHREPASFLCLAVFKQRFNPHEDGTSSQIKPEQKVSGLAENSSFLQAVREQSPSVPSALKVKRAGVATSPVVP